jgi:hypothetical protein
MYYTETDAFDIIDNTRLYYCVLRCKYTYILLWCKDAAVYADRMVYVGAGHWELTIGQTPVAAHRLIHYYYHSGDSNTRHIHRGWCICGCEPRGRYEGRE